MVGRFTFVWVFLGVILASLQDGTRGASMEKRSAAPERIADDYPDYHGVRYDEYPIIVPKKRAAILIDRLMVALKKAIEEEAEAGQGVSDGSAKTTYTLRPEDAVRTMDLQRRGQQKGRVYWRCYFNAVTCF